MKVDTPTALSEADSYHQTRSSDSLQLSEKYTATLESHPLPMEMADLEAHHANISSQALQSFDKEKFGTESGASSGSLRYAASDINSHS